MNREEHTQTQLENLLDIITEYLCMKEYPESISIDDIDRNYKIRFNVRKRGSYNIVITSFDERLNEREFGYDIEQQREYWKSIGQPFSYSSNVVKYDYDWFRANINIKTKKIFITKTFRDCKVEMSEYKVKEYYNMFPNELRKVKLKRIVE